MKAEFDDVAKVAAETGLSVSEVSSLAEQAWRERADGTDDNHAGLGLLPPDGNEPA